MIRIAQLSDCHFCNKRLDEKVRVYEEGLGILQEANPDVITICGDLFDGSVRVEDTGAQEAARLIGKTADIAPVIILRGNPTHDRTSVGMMRYVRGRYPIHVSSETEVVLFYQAHDEDEISKFVPVTIDEAEKVVSLFPYQAAFLSMPYPSTSFLAKLSTISPEQMRQAISAAITDVMRGFSMIQAVLPRIMLFHGTIVGAKISESQQLMGMDIELSPADIATCNLDLVEAGHIHHAQQIGNNIFYAGGLAYCSYGEEGKRGIWIHEIRPHAIEPKYELQSNFIQFSSIPMRICNIDLMEDPFIMPPAWANETMDVEVRVKMTDSDRETVRQTNWNAMFPNAKSVRVVPQIETVASIRCDEVRQAKKLRDKIIAYGKHVNIEIPESVLLKADQLETGIMNANTNLI